MFTLCSMNPLLTQKLIIPELSKVGRVPCRDATEELDLAYLSTVAMMDMNFDPETFSDWPEFHNGCASALRVYMKQSEGKFFNPLLMFIELCFSVHCKKRFVKAEFDF